MLHYAFGLVILLVLLEQSPVVGGWLLLVLTLGVLVIHSQS